VVAGQPTVYPRRLPVNCETHCVSGDRTHNLPIVSPMRVVQRLPLNMITVSKNDVEQFNQRHLRAIDRCHDFLLAFSR